MDFYIGSEVIVKYTPCKYSDYYDLKNLHGKIKETRGKKDKSFRVHIEGQENLSSSYGDFWLKKKHMKMVRREENIKMAKLTGFNNVAVIEQSGKDYYFALYDNVSVGDRVYVSNVAYGNPIHPVKEVITSDEAAQRYNKNITAEVICKVDTSAYEDRVNRRKMAEQLKKDMDKKIKEMQEVDKYAIYAERNPELAAMLKNYNKLID